MSYQKFTKDIGIVGLVNLLMALKAIIILPIITKLLGPESYGVWVQIIAALGFMAPLLTLSLPPALLRFLPAKKNREEIQNGVYSILAVIFVTALASALFLIFVSDYISILLKTQKILVIIFSLTMILECLNIVFFTVFRTLQEIKKYSFFILFQTVGEIGLIYIIVFLGYGISGIIFSLFFIRLINSLIMGGAIVKRIGLRIPNFSILKEYLHYGVPIMAGDISHWIIQSSDKYLLGFFLGTISVGYYAPVNTISNIIFFFVSPIAFVLPAILGKLYDENKIREVKIYLEYSLKYFLVIAIPSAFGLSVLAKQLLITFSTLEIAQQAYKITPIILLSVLLRGVTSIVALILGLTKKTKIGGIIVIAAALTNLGLNFILIPWLGMMGAAISYCLSNVLFFVLISYFSFKDIKLKLYYKFILKSASASVLMSLVVVQIHPSGILPTILTILLGTFLYGIFMFLFRGFEKKEILFFVNILKKGY